MLSIIARQIIHNPPQSNDHICFSNAKGRIVELGLGWIWLEKVADFATVQNAWHMNGVQYWIPRLSTTHKDDKYGFYMQKLVRNNVAPIGLHHKM